MSFMPEPGTPSDEVLLQRSRGSETSCRAQPRHAGRGDNRPLRHDHRGDRPEPLRPGGRTVGRVRRRGGATEHARGDRPVGVSAPPRHKLQPDGTPHDGDMPLGDGDLGLRVMGAGEEMELVNPVTAGTELVVETTLEAVTPKQTRSGPCVFVTTINTFSSAEGAVLNRNRRTVVLRDPLQES